MDSSGLIKGQDMRGKEWSLLWAQ